MYKKGIIIVNHQYGNASINIDYKIMRFKEEFSKLDIALEVIKNDAGKKWNNALVQEFVTLTELDLV